MSTAVRPLFAPPIIVPAPACAPRPLLRGTAAPIRARRRRPAGRIATISFSCGDYLKYLEDEA